MNFQQLKIIREAARQDYNLTEVANMLFTSQSGVSRHIRELEDELGIEIFVRRGKRLLGMTEPGKALLVIAERILNEASNVRRLADLLPTIRLAFSLLQRRILRHVIACLRSLKLFANFSRGSAGANPGYATGNCDVVAKWRS